MTLHGPAQVTTTALNVFPEGSGGLTRIGLVALAILSTLAVRRLLPRRWVPSGWLPLGLAAAVAFLAIRVGADTGFSEWLDHDVFERIGGETDDFPTWLVAGSAAALVLVAGRSWSNRRR
jgi:hypothetical protein